MTMLSRAALAAALSLLVSAPVLAADNYTIQSGGAARTIRAKDLGTSLAPMSIAIDGSGAERFTSGNPAFVVLPSGTVLAISATTLPLPTGAATSALQASGNASLSSIDTKTPALAAGRVPVDGSGVTQPTDTIVRSTSVDRGGTLTTASTAVTLVPANTARRGLAIQNRNSPGSAYSAATSVFMSCVATATADFHSLEIPAGALYETPSHHSGTGACSFISATANTPVYVREF